MSILEQGAPKAEERWMGQVTFAAPGFLELQRGQKLCARTESQPRLQCHCKGQPISSYETSKAPFMIDDAKSIGPLVDRCPYAGTKIHTKKMNNPAATSSLGYLHRGRSPGHDFD